MKELEIIKYLDKNYIIIDNYYVGRFNGIHDWGGEIVFMLKDIFSYDYNFVLSTFKNWAFKNGINENNWESSFHPRTLKLIWRPEKAIDLSHYGIKDAEARITSITSEDLNREIDAQILIDLKGKLNIDDFLSLLKCIGYEINLHWAENNFIPIKTFRAIKYNEIQNERKNNSYWQDWI
jgi:hypothetical protein